jgi:hypothetical protein
MTVGGKRELPEYFFTMFGHMASRPGMYGLTAPEAMVAALSGLRAGLALAGFVRDEGWKAIHRAILEEHGYNHDYPYYIDPALIKTGMSDHDRLVELLTIELETWKRVLGENSNP